MEHCVSAVATSSSESGSVSLIAASRTLASNTQQILRILVVDDVALARRRLIRLLASLPDNEVVAQAGDVATAQLLLRATSVDLVLLDIEMPGEQGFELLHPESYTSPNNPAVVFITAYPQHAARAFDVNAVDYVLKPVEPERLARALERVRVQRSQRQAPASAPETLLSLRDGHTTHRIAPSEIDWVEAAGNYVCVRATGRTLICRGTLAQVEKQLDPAQFLRVHRSRIVNALRVAAVEPSLSGDAQLHFIDGHVVTASRTHRQAIKRLIGR